MATIATGLWWDFSRPAPLQATITLPINTANLLISALTFLVGVAGGCFWDITAILLHSWKVKGRLATTFDLQQQVTLRNSPSSHGTLWKSLKIYRAWSQVPRQGLFWKTCGLAVPAAIIWVGFAAASIFVSRVATNDYGDTIARLQPDNCGFWFYDQDDVTSYGAYTSKMQNDTIQARTYTANFYEKTFSSLTATSRFVRPTLPYNVSGSAPCPIPATERCILGHNGAYSMTTDFLDSNNMFGINAKPEDRITLQIQVTCSPVSTRDVTNVTTIDNNTFIEWFLGTASGADTDVTYMYNLETPGTDVAYLIVPELAVAQVYDGWQPIPDFNRTDADVSVYFMSQNDLAYLEPVFDPWFSANGTYTTLLSQYNETVFLPDHFVGVMVCADQYVMCNPTTSSCTIPSGISQLEDSAVTRNDPGFNPAQLATAGRFTLALVHSNTYNSVSGLGAAALWANKFVFGYLSNGLPENQWQVEVLGWFQTNLAKLQAYIVQYAINAGDLGQYGYVVSPYNVNTNNSEDAGAFAARQAQCSSQLVQTAGEVQNFSFLAVMIVVCVSVAIIVLSLSLESIMNFIAKHWGGETGLVHTASRQADDKLHLLRMALGDPEDGNHWVLGKWEVPILAGLSQFERPAGSEELAAYVKMSELSTDEASDYESIAPLTG